MMNKKPKKLDCHKYYGGLRDCKSCNQERASQYTTCGKVEVKIKPLKTGKKTLQTTYK